METFHTGQHPPGGQLMLATVMFTDVVGFTARTQGDEAETIRLVRADLTRISSHITANGGRSVKETGDGVLAVFTSAQRAIQCAMSLQFAFAERAASGRPLEHRMSLHVGEIEVIENDVYGDGVNVCARLLEKASPHAVVMSDAVHSIVKVRLPMAARKLGRLRLAGVSEKVSAWEVRFRPGRRVKEPADEIAAAAAPVGNWYCPVCQYNLRGRAGGACPECGWAFDAELRTVSLLPWVYRDKVGLHRALVRTARLVIRRPAFLAAELHRPIAARDAALFFRTILAWVVGAMMLCFIADRVIERRSRVVIGSLLLIFFMGNLMVVGFLWMGMAGARLIFRARSLSPDLQNRLEAIGSYTAAPLVLMIGMVPLMWAQGFLPLGNPQLAALIASAGIILIVAGWQGWLAIRVRQLAAPSSSKGAVAGMIAIVAGGWLCMPACAALLLAMTVAFYHKAAPNPAPALALPASTTSSSGGASTQVAPGAAKAN